MRKRVIIMRGISGSGKSTYVRDAFPNATVVSADDHFMVDGEYKFDITQIQEAHNACWRAFYEAMKRGDELIVVDNTNTSNDLVGAYWSPAMAMGYDVEIVQLTCSHDTAIKRCQRTTPPEVILEQHEQLMSCSAPLYWKNYQHVNTN